MSSNATYISTATTTVVRTGAAKLNRIIIGETSAGAITVYDGVSTAGRVIAVLKVSIPEGVYDFGDVRCVDGLTIVTAGASKLTVVYE